MKILELESGLNDAIAISILYAVLAIDSNDFGDKLTHTIINSITHSFIELVAGAIIGIAIASIFLLKRPLRGLKKVIKDTDSKIFFVYAMLLFAYGSASLLMTSGFLATYILATVLGDKFLSKELLRFASMSGWIAQIIAFTVLGLLVTPHSITFKDVKAAMAITLILTFLVRPLVVIVCTLFSKITNKERYHLMLFNQRGALPIILSTIMLFKSPSNMSSITTFNQIFLIALMSMFCQMLFIPFGALLSSKKGEEEISSIDAKNNNREN
jgi:cell volume regulation protein A